MSIIKVLLVDDDEDDFILTREILRDNPDNKRYQLSWCNNYSEAINAMLKSHYDIYLVDYRLGKDSGIDLLNEAIKSNCTEPIIILTGKGDMKIDQEAMRLGAADYLIKDKLSSQSLERAIRYAVEQNKTLQKLKASEKKFRIIFERSKDPMMITNPYGTILDANNAALDFFETTLVELSKKNASEIYRNKADREAYVAEIEAEGSVSDLELEMITATGKIKYCSLSSFLQVSQHANEELYYTIIHDLTYRLRQEKESSLTETLDIAERFARSFSKEIQDPLSSINLAIDELAITLNSEDSLALADIIKSNCARLNGITSNLIESTSRSQIKLRKVELSPLLAEVIDAAELDYDIRINYTSPEENLSIQADSESLKEVLRILLKNSADAKNDTTSVSISVIQTQNWAQLKISDNGVGIRQEDLPHIF